MESVVIDASLLVAAVLNVGPNDRWARGIIASKHLIAPVGSDRGRSRTAARRDGERDLQPAGDRRLPENRQLSDRSAALRTVRRTNLGAAFQPDALRRLVRRLRRGAGRTIGHARCPPEPSTRSQVQIPVARPRPSLARRILMTPIRDLIDIPERRGDSSVQRRTRRSEAAALPHGSGALGRIIRASMSSPFTRSLRRRTVQTPGRVGWAPSRAEGDDWRARGEP